MTAVARVALGVLVGYTAAVYLVWAATSGGWVRW